MMNPERFEYHQNAVEPALMFIIVGVMTLVVVALIYFQPSIRHAQPYKKKPVPSSSPTNKRPQMTSSDGVNIAPLLIEWYETRVAKYEGAKQYSRSMFDDLIRFVENHSEHNVVINEKDMIDFLNHRGVSSITVNNKLLFKGVQTIIYGNVRTGNYGT